jgi:FkbM family methyltransferase
MGERTLAMNFKRVNGMKWPASDTDCMAVVFNTLSDLDLALSFVAGRSVVIQAGGNCGVWPKHLAKHFDMVVTFEPEPSNFDCLVENCSERNIITIWGALGASSNGVSMILPEGDRNMGACAIGGVGSIPMIRIDDIHLRIPSLDFIQLDVEGYELEVLKGAEAMISKFHPLLMIEDKGLSEKYGAPQGWSEKYLAERGYRVAARVNRDIIYRWVGRDAK